MDCMEGMKQNLHSTVVLLKLFALSIF